MAAHKKVAKKKASAKKPGPARKASKAAAPAKKKAAAPGKKAAGAAKKPVARAAAPKKAVAADRPTTSKPVAPAPPAGAVTAEAVLLGHVMALRPRVHVGFKPSAFTDAKRALAEKRYATIEEAARAVAEKAIEISNEFSPGNPFARR